MNNFKGFIDAKDDQWTSSDEEDTSTERANEAAGLDEATQKARSAQRKRFRKTWDDLLQLVNGPVPFRPNHLA